LWTLGKFKRQEHDLLLDVMKGFKLLRLLHSPGDARQAKYVVPAMLPTSELPPEYTDPHWWCPSKASGAAVMQADTTVRAEMRIVYEVLGGSLPSGCMSELQVSLVSLGQSGSVEEEQTAASEAAVVERICGTVLSEAYDCGRGAIREWIIISRAAPTLDAGVLDSIRVMGWIELYSAEGTTDWRLFTRVMQEIESMEQRALTLCFRKKTFHVDSHGKLSNALEIPSEELLFPRFTFKDGGQKRVRRELVVPSVSWKELTLVQHTLVHETSAAAAAAAAAIQPHFIEEDKSDPGLKAPTGPG
jgi:hypothetical protein